MIGVKEFIAEFHEEIDWVDKLKKRAKKEKKKESDIQKEWDEAREDGESIHNTLADNDVNNLKNVVKYTYTESTASSPTDNKLEPGTIYLEKPLTSEKYKLKGRPDKLEVKGNKIYITDRKTWKTLYRNALTILDNGFKIPPKKFYPPIEHLDFCNYNEAVLQLSFYAYLAWVNNKNLKIEELYIEHIIHNRKKIIKKIMIQVPYLRSEIQNLLKTIELG